MGGLSSVLCCALALGCGAASAPVARPAGAVSGEPASRGSSTAIAVPDAPAERLLPATRVAAGLHNPRGVLELPDGRLLVAEAGLGDPDNPDTGRLTRLTDENADGDFDDADERSALMDGMRSTNIIHVVRRDEVFGMADIAVGDGHVLVTHAFFGSPTTVYELDGDTTRQWGEVHGNLNALAYHPGSGRWLAASSSSDELVEVEPGGGQERIVKFPPLADGQDAVPGYLVHEAGTGAVLVSLFTGSPAGEEGGDGTEIVRGAGKVVRVDPASGATHDAITGLTAPTDLALDAQGRVYVLELCDGFADPIETREELAKVGHGGFRRFSGRLLRVDLQSGEVLVLARGLDTPTNLSLAGDHLHVSTGMGTPGRPIPGPEGETTLDGVILRLPLPTD